MREFFYYQRKPSKQQIKKDGVLVPIDVLIPTGLCIAAIYNTGTLSIGLSRCGKGDIFSYKIGRNIARGRAIKSPLIVETDVKDEDAAKKFTSLVSSFITNL